MPSYPGNYAIPGGMQPGRAIPGAVGNGGGSVPTVVGYTYTDAQVLVFPDYLESSDDLHWETLVAVPGASYTFIILVDTHLPQLPGGGRTWVVTLT